MSDFEALSDITLYRMLPPVTDLYIVQNVTLYSVRARLGSAPLLWCAFVRCMKCQPGQRSYGRRRCACAPAPLLQAGERG